MLRIHISSFLALFLLALVGCSDGDSADSNEDDAPLSGAIVSVTGTIDDTVTPATMTGTLVIDPLDTTVSSTTLSFTASQLTAPDGATDIITGRWKGTADSETPEKTAAPTAIGLIALPGLDLIPAHGDGTHGGERTIEMHVHTHDGALLGHYGDSEFTPDFNSDLGYTHPHLDGASQPEGFYNFLTTSGEAPAWNAATKTFSFTINSTLNLGDDEEGDHSHGHGDDGHSHGDTTDGGDHMHGETEGDGEHMHGETEGDGEHMHGEAEGDGEHMHGEAEGDNEHMHGETEGDGEHMHAPDEGVESHEHM